VLGKALVRHHDDQSRFPQPDSTLTLGDVFSPFRNRPYLRLLLRARLPHSATASSGQGRRGRPTRGANQDIFYYQFRYISEIPVFVVRMTFYGGFVVIACASPSVRVGK
jgi:hypothetical protein